MEGCSLQLLSSVLQYTLRSFCGQDSQWVYAIFWRILPRNYPPPKWESGGTLDRSKENKRNWILVWEDGFCNFSQCHRSCCESSTKFGPSIFFKLSHEVYNYGEGVLGKVAANYRHKYIYREDASGNESHDFPSWSSSADPQPRAWELQFKSGIKTIAVVAVREGLVQLGSLEKVVEDINFVISIQRKFSYLHSIPGIFTLQRPLLTSSLLCNAIMSDGGKSNLPYKSSSFMTESKLSEASEFEINHGASQLVLGKRFYGQAMQSPSPNKAINLGWNAPHAPTFSGPMLPSLSSGLGPSPAMLTPMNHRGYLHSPVCAALDFKRRADLEFISTVKTEPIVEGQKQELITTSMNLDSAPTNLGAGSEWAIQ